MWTDILLLRLLYLVAVRMVVSMHFFDSSATKDNLLGNHIYLLYDTRDRLSTGVPDPFLGPKGIRLLLAFRGLSGYVTITLLLISRIGIHLC
jgi:hypothetical protein